MTLPFGANIDIRDTVPHRDVMKEYGLDPNGGIPTSLKGEDFFIGTRPYSFTTSLYRTIIPHHVTNIMLAPNGNVINTC
jgi:hypothetical protein